MKKTLRTTGLKGKSAHAHSASSCILYANYKIKHFLSHGTYIVENPCIGAL